MNITLQVPSVTELKPRITVIGVGGAGGNAVNNMIASGLDGVDFIVANTDAQALAASSAEHRIQLGVTLTEGLGAGARPEIGAAAAEEALDDIRSQISGAHMVFIAAGMGGGTGTGASGVIARIAKEAGVLTVGVVTKPFLFEGSRRMRVAEAGIAEMRRWVDTLIVIPNQNLFRIATEKTTFADAFVLADQVLYSGIACVVDLIVKEGMINLDFADVRTIMEGMGTAMMGTGEASGENRAIIAADDAMSNPLLDDVTLRGAKGLLLSIVGGRDMTLFEVDSAVARVRDQVDPEANIIVGATFDASLGERLRVSIVASGMSHAAALQRDPAAGAAPVRPAPPGRSGLPPPLPYPNAGPAQPVRYGGASDGLSASDLAQRLSEALDGERPPLGAGQPSGHGVSWRAPGDVTIEPRGSSGRGQRGDAPGGPASPFAPHPPAAARRGGTRMPELGDFPPHAQREFHAKTPGASARGYASDDGHRSQAAPDWSVPPARKPTLFERLTGLGRRARGDDPEPAPARSRRHGGPIFAEPSDADFDPPGEDGSHAEQPVENPHARPRRGRGS